MLLSTILDPADDTVAVSPSGWTDLSEVSLTGQRWLRQQ